MTIPIRDTALVTASTASSAEIAIENCQDFGLHRFWITLGTGWAGAADVFIRGSGNGSNWVDLNTAVNTVGNHVVEVERPFQFLQLEWSGNSGSKSITVRMEQIYSDPTTPGF